MDGAVWAIIALMALMLGAAVGWLLATRGQAEGRATAASLRMQLDGIVRERDEARSEAAAIRSARDAAERELAAIGAERAGLIERRAALEAHTQALTAALDAERQAREVAVRDLGALRTGLAEREKALEERIADLRLSQEEAKAALSAQFSEVGAKLLGEAQRTFLERADQRFNQAGEKSEERLKQMLAPVDEKLKAYDSEVRRIEKERQEAYGSLTSLVTEMREGQERVQNVATGLMNSLRNAPKARGRWGEQQLRNVLESCGLTEHVDFQTEVSMTTEEGRMRPDAIVRIPGGKSLVIDAKVSLNAYQDAFGASDEAARLMALGQHCASMKAHVNALGNKAYQNQFPDTPDYVVMFIPGEHFLSAALEHDPTLWDFAFEKKVLLATPTNLVAIARTVAGVWRQEGLAREAQQIGQLGKEMYERLAVAAGHLRTMGSGLNTAVANYNRFVGSFERNVLTTGRRFKELNVDTGARELGEVAELEALPRHAGGETDIAAE